MIYILDSKRRQKVATVPKFNSLLWVPRYANIGEFELTIPLDSPAIPFVKIDNFVARDPQEGKAHRIMCIESIKYQTDLANGDVCVISGRSIEVVLLRLSSHQRDVFYPVTGQLGTVSKKVIETVCDGKRIGLQFRASGPEANYNILYNTIGEMIYGGDQPGDGELRVTPFDLLQALAALYGLGFRILEWVPGSVLMCEVYSGTDRSQTVEFSPAKGNLISSEYVEDWTDFVSQVFVSAGQNAGPTVNSPLISALESVATRRVCLMPTSIQDTGWQDRYREIGQKFLQEHRPRSAFTCEIAPEVGYKYGVDYELGDIVKIDDGYGHVYRARITEIVETIDETGREVHPTLEIMEA